MLEIVRRLASGEGCVLECTGLSVQQSSSPIATSVVQLLGIDQVNSNGICLLS